MDSAFLKAMSKLIWRNVKMRYGGEPSSLDYDKDLILCKSKNEKTAEHIPKLNNRFKFLLSSSSQTFYCMSNVNSWWLSTSSH